MELIKNQIDQIVSEDFDHPYGATAMHNLNTPLPLEFDSFPAGVGTSLETMVNTGLTRLFRMNQSHEQARKVFCFHLYNTIHRCEAYYLESNPNRTNRHFKKYLWERIDVYRSVFPSIPTNKEMKRLIRTGRRISQYALEYEPKIRKISLSYLDPKFLGDYHFEQCLNH